MSLTAVPTLDDLAAHPERAAELPVEVLQGLLSRCVSLQSGLLGALITVSARNGHRPAEPDTLLDVTAAAARLGASKDWLYRHAKQLPFRVPQGRLLRFSSHGIARYIQTRQGRLSV
ncbi:MAG: hypothetical protein HY699_23435 [Deltaproteobacteria bacterium]|nr:hypothetical protein [Deltaproteobacteria bacterium]